MGLDRLQLLTAFDGLLIVLALGTIVVVSQAILSFSGRVERTGGLARSGWLAIGSICIGLGIWTVAVLTSLPMRTRELPPYPLGIGSLVATLSVLGAFFCLLAVTVHRPTWARAVIGGVIAAPLFAATQYLTASALDSRAIVGAESWLAIGSAVVALIAWSGAIWISIRFTSERASHQIALRFAAAGLFAGAVVTTAYSAFVALSSGPGLAPPPVGAPVLLMTPEAVLTLSVVVVALTLLVMVAATVDRRLQDKRVETEALRRSEDRFRSLVQASAQIVWTTAPDGQMLGEQTSWSEFTGQEPAAFRGWGWFNAIHPEDRERTAGLWEETLANRRSIELEHRVRRHDGKYRDCVARVVPVLQPDGAVREWVGTHTDVTDRARMQQERDLLAEAGRMLSSSLDDRETLGAVARLLVPRIADWCAIDVHDDDRGLRRLVATHQDPYRSTLLREIQPAAGGAAPARGVMRVLEVGESDLIREVDDEVLEEIAPDPEHRRLLAEVGVTSLLCVPLTARGQVLGVLTLGLSSPGEEYDLRDLALVEELGRRAAIAIDNARLYSASQAAIRARDEVLGVVSHDLRNPLGAISMASELLLDLDLTPDDQQRHLDIIRRSADSANRLIRDLLDVTQTENGDLAVDLQSADPARLVEESCELMRPLAEEKSLRLACQLPSDLTQIRADPSRVHQILSNLIGNAIKFTPTGGEILVRLKAIEGGVQFSVIDSGPGIAADDLPHLFERHWRARETAHLGSGLGLAISRGIIEAHRGKIWAESRVGSGAAFHFIIPAVDPQIDRSIDRERVAVQSSAGSE